MTVEIKMGSKIDISGGYLTITDRGTDPRSAYATETTWNEDGEEETSRETLLTFCDIARRIKDASGRNARIMWAE